MEALITRTANDQAEIESPSRPIGGIAPDRSIPLRRGANFRLLAVLLVALLIAAFLIWHFAFPARQTKSYVPAVPVGVSKITTGDMPVQLMGLGTVTPTATVTVQTQINGQLTAVGYREGQIVQKGQFLAQIDPRPYEIALQQAQGALAHDTGLLNQAKSDLARYVALDRANAIAKQTVTDQEFLVQQDTGLVTEDDASVNTQKLNLAYCHIVAPVTGRAGLRLVDPGNYVQTSSATGLVVLTQLQPITVIFVLPEDQIQAVSQQTGTGTKLQVDAFDRNQQKVIAQGVLTTIDNTVDTTTGTIKLRATFPNENLALFPNEFVNAQLLLQTLKNVTEVPVRAVQTGAPGTFVYLVRPNRTAHVQVIKPGVTDGDYTQVLSGLKPGDTVVTDGAGLLREGAKVRVMPNGNATPVQVNNGPGAPPGQQPQNARSMPRHKHSKQPQ
jgi:multidrug efflux system membrane fusion protein